MNHTLSKPELVADRILRLCFVLQQEIDRKIVISSIKDCNVKITFQNLLIMKALEGSRGTHMNAIGEILKAIYFFIDGTNSGVIDQVEFTRATDKVIADVVEGWKAIKDSEVKEVTLHFKELITTDEDLKAKFVMPADYKINKNFLNA